MLAEWGAQVIKIEPPIGDPMRRFFDLALSDGHAGNPPFELDNRGKRSIVLDIQKPEGRDAAIRLAREADVFITNVRAAALEACGSGLRGWSAPPIRAWSIAWSPATALQGEDQAGRGSTSPPLLVALEGGLADHAPKGMEPFTLRTGTGDHTCSLAVVSGRCWRLLVRARTHRQGPAGRDLADPLGRLRHRHRHGDPAAAGKDRLHPAAQQCDRAAGQLLPNRSLTMDLHQYARRRRR